MDEEVRQSCRIRGVPVHLHVHYILVLGSYLYVVPRLRLPVVHRILLHAHERGVRIRLGIAVARTEGFYMLLVFLKLLLVPLQFLCHLLLSLGRTPLFFRLARQLPVLLVKFLNLSCKQLAVYGIRHGVCIRSVVLGYTLVYL